MGWWRRGAAAWLVLGAVLLIGAVPVARDVLRPGEQQVVVEAYDRTDDPREIVALIESHPDFVLHRATAQEDAGTVVLRVSMRSSSRWWWSGGDIAETRKIRIRLDQPLAGREVRDGRLGTPVPER
ncbi:hypothetical protein DLJ46_14035 [Micromonospora globispora]|uniref:Uncharacterized protein n=1 Tax=Micromonospora globispora TaxID=1450148 RepID=A0A317K716_9ACTN|nr:hypothetical protein [Micromonospora globispora]PWU47642.1 hypothetical protein DLJ46_14035 [Micromonospora globispora]RQW98612.1 hypothetical protein DKL51_10150 [Micromonospora globispora]